MKGLKVLIGIAAVYGVAHLYKIYESKNKQRAKEATVHVLENSHGLKVHISTVGCVIQKLYVPDAKGKFEDIVLGFDTMEPYLDGTSPYFGAVVGRVANRIARAQFLLEGKTYHLYANDGHTSLHGGKIGFDKRNWTPRNYTSIDGVQHLELKYISKNYEEGYPGEVTATVTYSLTDDNTLHVVMEATTDHVTLVNLAQHSYFNLGGHSSGSVLNHKLKIHGDHYTPVDNELIPTGEIKSVTGTPFDFLSLRPVGERISQVGGYDHNYVLFGLGEQAAAKTKQGAVSKIPQLAATVYDPSNGRSMDVLTTSPGLQFYSGNFLNGIRGKEGAIYDKHGALCLETQVFPDAVHHDNFPSAVLEPGQKYKHVVQYKFYTM